MYISGSNGKTVPPAKPDSFYGNVRIPTRNTLTKTPNSVMITKKLTQQVGFFMGSPSTFDSLSAGNKTAGTTYVNVWSGSKNHSANEPDVGTTLNIHPCAWSGSAADASSIAFVYDGGLDGSGRG